MDPPPPSPIIWKLLIYKFIKKGKTNYIVLILMYHKLDISFKKSISYRKY